MSNFRWHGCYMIAMYTGTCPLSSSSLVAYPADDSRDLVSSSLCFLLLSIIFSSPFCISPIPLHRHRDLNAPIFHEFGGDWVQLVATVASGGKLRVVAGELGRRKSVWEGVREWEKKKVMWWPSLHRGGGSNPIVVEANGEVLLAVLHWRGRSQRAICFRQNRGERKRGGGGLEEEGGRIRGDIGWLEGPPFFFKKKIDSVNILLTNVLRRQIFDTYVPR